MQIVPIPGGAGASFRLNSLPENAFAHSSWKCAELHVLALAGRGGRLLLLGRPGTGKSLLLRSLDRTLTAQGVRVRQFCRGNSIVVDLADDDVLFIDEADLLSTAEVEHVLQLPNTVVMAGLPSLSERLPPSLDAFRCVTLEPLTPEDVARFVVARLVASGRPRGLFTPEALLALARQSDGLLRLIIILAGAGMFFAEQRGAATVTADDVAEAVSMRSGLQPEGVYQPVPEGESAGKEVLDKSAVPEAPEKRSAWLGLVAARTWHWERIAGLAVWAGVSLGVVGVAAIAALQVKPVPSLAIQEVQGRSAPTLANSALPDLALSPAAQPAAPAPVQLATTFPPLPDERPSAPALAPISSLEPAPFDVDTSQAPDTSVVAATQVPPDPLAPPPTLPDLVQSPATVLAFVGPILNDTMGQNGQLSLYLRIRGAHGPVAAVFQASRGLIGSGVLTGDIDSDGRMVLSGRLMMGSNPFDCALHATLKDERLIGAATFVRATSGALAHSTFRLSRS